MFSDTARVRVRVKIRVRVGHRDRVRVRVTVRVIMRSHAGHRSDTEKPSRALLANALSYSATITQQKCC